jgi:hypothetical protein
MSAADIIEVFDHIVGVIMIVVFVLWMSGAFDK